MAGQTDGNKKNRVQNNYIVQAGILAAAGIISRIIGLLYRGPLTGIIGDEGNGYYTSAYNIYTIILLISSYSIPAAVSKVIAQKLALKEYRNAHRIFICALWYVIAVGGIASLFVFFFGELLVKGAAVTVLKIFAPTIFLSGLLGVLRGYFQAHKTMLQTSVSQILEQILNAVISILAAYLFITMALGSMGTYEVDDTTGHVIFAGEQRNGESKPINDVLGIYGEQENVSGADSGIVSGADSETGMRADIGTVSGMDSGTAPQKPSRAGTETSTGAVSKTTADELSAEQQEWNTKHAMYGAAGSALGTGAGVLIALLFMLGIYMLNRGMIMRRVKRDRNPHVDSYGDILKLVLSVVTPFILSTAIYNFSTSLNQTIYTHVCMGVKGMAEAEAYTLYGIYGGKAVVISNIPIALASAMSSAILPGIAAHYARKELQQARQSVGTAIKSTMLISIPAAVGLGVLAKPITQVLFPQKESLDMAASLLCALAVSVVFYALSTLSNAVLQGIGRVNVPVMNAAAALMLQTVLVALLLLFTDLGLYSLVIANIVYSGSMCLLNGRSVKKHLNYKQEWVRTYVIPFTASLFMGAAAFGVYHGLHRLIHSNIICLAAAVLIAVPVYFVLVIRFGGLKEAEFQSLPKGRSLLRIARKLHLM